MNQLLWDKKIAIIGAGPVTGQEAMKAADEYPFRLQQEQMAEPNGRSDV